MFEFLKTSWGKVTMSALTGCSAITTVAVNMQSVQLSQLGQELAWWAVVLGGVALLAASIFFIGLVLWQRHALIETDRLARMLFYGTSVVVVAVGLSVTAWAIVAAGLLPWATAQSAILINVGVPLWLLRAYLGTRHA
jgi:hypothetical protein